MVNKNLKHIISLLLQIFKIAYLVLMIIFFIYSFSLDYNEGDTIFMILDPIFDLYFIFIIIISLLKIRYFIHYTIYRIGFILFLVYFIFGGIVVEFRSNDNFELSSWIAYFIMFFPMLLINFRMAFIRQNINRSE